MGEILLGAQSANASKSSSFMMPNDENIISVTGSASTTDLQVFTDIQGKLITISLSLDASKEQPILHDKSHFVTVNVKGATSTRRFTLPVSFQPRAVFEVIPGVLHLGVVRSGDRINKTVRIKIRDSAVEIRRMVTKQPWMAAKLEKVDGSFFMVISLDSETLPVGSFDGEIEIFSTLSTSSVFHVIGVKEK